VSAIGLTRAAERPDVAATHRSLLAIFLINGFVLATWVAYIPMVKERFGLGDGSLGLTLLAGALGSIAALLLSGGLIGRFGSRLITTITTLSLCVVLPLVVLNPSYSLLLATLAILGGGIGSMDVAMNAQAVAVESALARPIMSTLHGLYSVGALLGAGLASISLSFGIDPVVHVVGVAILLAVIGVLSLRHLLPASVDRTPDGPVFAWPSGPLISLGIIAFLALLSEGAMADWSAVYFHDGLGTDLGFAAAGFAAFSLTMALGRFMGDALRSRTSSEKVVRFSGAIAAVGLGITLLLGNPIVALVGLACVGIGLSNVVPVIFSAAGQTRGIATGNAVAAVATTGYFGFIVGPPSIGFVAQATTLSLGIGLVVGLLGLIALLANNVRQAGGTIGPGNDTG